MGIVMANKISIEKLKLEKTSCLYYYERKIIQIAVEKLKWHLNNKYQIIMNYITSHHIPTRNLNIWFPWILGTHSINPLSSLIYFWFPPFFPLIFTQISRQFLLDSYTKTRNFFNKIESLSWRFIGFFRVRLLNQVC